MPALAPSRLTNRRSGRAASVALLLLALAGCMSPMIRVDRGPRGIPVGPPGWDLQTREHVDLWLHGYAMLQDDSGALPFFRPGYRNELAALKSEARVFTLLDANVDRLAPRLATNSQLVNGQFAPLYFQSWADLRAGVRAFLEANGNPSRASGSGRRAVVVLREMFPTAEDRDWLRTFVLSLEDERENFYREHWEERQRRSVLAHAAADSALRAASEGGLRRYAANASLSRGSLILSLPLGGEGRAVLTGVERPLIAVPRPMVPAEAASVVYVFTHELVTPAVDVATREFDGELPRGLSADAYTTSALVRAGHHLLQRAVPGMADDYARYYLQLAGRDAGSDAGATLAAVFALPDALETAVLQQVDDVWGGI